MMSAYAGGAAGPSITTFGSGVRRIASGVAQGLLVITPAAYVLSAPSRAYRLYKHGTTVAAFYHQLKGVVPALGPDHKLGVRVGTEATTRPLGDMPWFITMQYGPRYLDRMPILYPDIGVMAVPNDSSRLLWESNKKSMSDGHIGRTDRVAGPSQTRKTMRGASAPKKRSKKPKFVRYRTGGCPPGYTYDPKRKMCIHNSYR